MDKIYVSRSRLPKGKIIGESVFEQYLVEEGYAIFQPELYDIYQQLAVYNKALKIIFCDGAAIHTCVLLPDLQADVAVIARRRDPRWAGRNIIDQFTGYHKYVTWVDCIKDQYQFGLESWHALSIVDWFEVSLRLRSEGFVENPFHGFHDIDFPALVRSELRNYISNITDLPEYNDFMMRLKEPLPAE